MVSNLQESSTRTGIMEDEAYTQIGNTQKCTAINSFEKQITYHLWQKIIINGSKEEHNSLLQRENRYQINSRKSQLGVQIPNDCFKRIHWWGESSYLHTQPEQDWKAKETLSEYQTDGEKSKGGLLIK